MEIVKTNKTWSPQKKVVDRYYEYDAYTKEESVPRWWNGDNHRLIESKGINGVPTFKKFCTAHKIYLSEKGCPIMGCNHITK